ncbi:CDP-glucose 4,6-dehydratase [Caenimonas terrae]|uniref:CDP-glucose 4,6-dehydratase n=1 Tax=Caenimonas terrae TaxID=696074 RepID=A0ABW0NCT0_9BURK
MVTPAAIDPAFWRGRRVFLTGHTGFKGSWLALWLQRLGADVTGYALAPEPGPNLFDVLHRQQPLRSLIADVRDGAALRQALADSRSEVVLHLAAQPLVRRSYQDPVETYSTNVMGTVNLLEAVRSTPEVRSVVVVTSDKCYENREWDRGYRETDAMGGHDPYSSSKGCAELVSAAYRSSFFNARGQQQPGVALASARAGNVIGGGDWAVDRLVPDLLRAFAQGEPASIRNPSAVRPWQHVLEPLRGYLLLAQQLAIDGQRWAQAWNFGPADTDALTVGEIADRLCALWGPPAAWATDGQQHPHEARWLRLDCSKAREELGWSPRWDLERALREIVRWHRASAAGADMRALSLQQIDDFETTSHHA